VLTFLSRWWQLESLYRANAKYRPVWEPRYLLFETSGEVPRIVFAAARAEGFLALPALPKLGRRRRRPRTSGESAQPPLGSGPLPTNTPSPD
jgi:lysyl-tRNA synthetase class 2